MKESRKLVSRAITKILLFILPLLCVLVFYWGNFIPFYQRIQNYTSSGSANIVTNGSIVNLTVDPAEPEPQKFLFSRLLGGEDRMKLEDTGFACNSAAFSIHCVTNRPVTVDTRNMIVRIPSDQAAEETVVRPYARQDDHNLLRTVTPVKILHGNTTPPVCEYRHDVPAVIFSSSGFVGNVFHEFNEIIIPLFLTTKHFKSRVLFILEDYKPSFVSKYSKVMSQLSAYDVMDPTANGSVHCFSGAIVGLKFHGHLSINSTDVPQGYSILDFKKFLRQTYNLKFNHVSQIKRPILMLLSRGRTRRLLNEEEMVATMKELGFRVLVVGREKVVSNLSRFGRLMNSCSVFVAAHGAGITNELFLPEGAVMVQVDLIGLEWAAKTYYGKPARAMGVHYLRYKIEPEESSLFKVFWCKRSHPALTDPASVGPQAGKEIYLNGQNARVNLTRFWNTLVQAISLVSDSDL